jgi:aquaporin related protein
MAIILSVAEAVGAILGYGLLKLLVPDDIFSIPPNGTCVTSLHPGMSVTKGFFVEFFLTCALISIICGVWDPRNRSNGDSAPLRIGKLVAKDQRQCQV